MNICYYHSADLDGYCSGAIVKRKYPDCEMVGINYGEDFDFKKVEDRDVIMVDFCLQPFDKYMPKLSQTARSVLWIDHHKTEMDEYEAYDKTKLKAFTTCLADDKAACELAWLTFFPQEEMPNAVKLLGRYDVWDLQYDQNVMPFQWGMRAREHTDLASTLWAELFDPKSDKLGTIIDEGWALLRCTLDKQWNRTIEGQWTYQLPADCKHPIKMELTYLKNDAN